MIETNELKCLWRCLEDRSLLSICWTWMQGTAGLVNIAEKSREERKKPLSLLSIPSQICSSRSLHFWREKGTLLSLKREIIMRQWLCPLHLIKLCLVNSHAKKKSADFNVGSDVWWAILRRFDPWLWYHTFNFLLLI